MRWYVQNFVGRYFYERTLFEADDQCQKHQLGLNYHSGRKKLGPLKSGTDRKFSDLPNGLNAFFHRARCTKTTLLPTSVGNVVAETDRDLVFVT